jgi:hypothetical protein
VIDRPAPASAVKRMDDLTDDQTTGEPLRAWSR